MYAIRSYYGTKYHKIIIQGSGIGTVTDALYAIEKLVYIDKEYTLEQLNEILKNNWENDKLLQQKVRRIENVITSYSIHYTKLYDWCSEKHK